jgi:hypothetical protein
MTSTAMSDAEIKRLIEDAIQRLEKRLRAYIDKKIKEAAR